jgi:hypothetical protein
MTMHKLTALRSPTAADLKDHLHDIQEDVVTPVFMQHGRHAFLKAHRWRQGAVWLRPSRCTITREAFGVRRDR